MIDKIRPWSVRLRQRKFLVPMAGIVLIVLNDILLLGIDPEHYKYIVGLIIGFVASEGYVDGKQISSQGTTEDAQ